MASVPISTVLLDAGGIILDESEHEAVRAEIIAEVISTAVPGYSANDYWSDVEEAVASFAPRTYEYVFWKRLKPDLEAFKQFYDLHMGKWLGLRPPIKLAAGIVNEIEAMSRNLKLGIAGQYGVEIPDLLEQHDSLDCFASRLTQDDFTITKPDPRYLEQIASALGVRPEECIMVGDRIDNDVIPAKQIGMKTVLVRTGLHKNQQPRIPAEMPDLEMQGIQGLAAAVEMLMKQA